MYGRPAGASRQSTVAGARLAAASAEYVGRGNKCSANDDTCEGAKAKGTDFCVGHLRSKAKVEEKVDAPDTADKD
jgi:hypothetical protein